MRDDKVQCQCCGKWMVPRPIYGRSFMDALVGWMGTSKVVGNMCPFCLSEDWDGVERVHRGVLFKTVALALAVFITYASIIIFIILVSPIEEMLNKWAFIVDNIRYIHALCILASIYFGYRSYKWLVNTTKLPF